MPIHRGRTSKKGSKNSYYQWGHHGKRYSFRSGSKRSRKMAREKAARQARAAFANGWRGRGGSRRVSKRNSKK